MISVSVQLNKNRTMVQLFYSLHCCYYFTKERESSLKKGNKGGDICYPTFRSDSNAGHQTTLDMDFEDIEKSKRWPSYGWQSTKTKFTSSFVLVGSFPNLQALCVYTKPAASHQTFFYAFCSNMASVSSNMPNLPEAK